MSSTESRRFIVVGVGGTGGWLSAGLSKMIEHGLDGDNLLILIDGDDYEVKNVERQQFNSLGNKAEVKAAELQPQLYSTQVVPVGKFVVEETKGRGDTTITAEEVLEENDVIFTTVDNFAARKAIFDAAAKFDNIDVFTGGNDDHLFGSSYHYQRRDGKDITAHPNTIHEEFINPPDKNPGDMSCEEKMSEEGSVQLLATNMAVASLLLARVKKTIIDGEEDTETEIFLDLDVGKMASYERVPETISQEDSGLAV